MKKIAFIALLMLMGITARGQDALFKSFENVSGVSTVYISKSLLSMMPSLKVNNRDLAKMAGKLDHIQILSAEKANLISRLKKQTAATYTSKNGYEEVMRANESGQKVFIYQKRYKNGKHEFVLVTDAMGRLSVVNILGTLTLKDIQSLTK